jgi:hypothetical protein
MGFMAQGYRHSYHLPSAISDGFVQIFDAAFTVFAKLLCNPPRLGRV